MFTCFCYDVIMKGLLPKCQTLLFFICRIAEEHPILDEIKDTNKGLKASCSSSLRKRHPSGCRAILALLVELKGQNVASNRTDEGLGLTSIRHRAYDDKI